MHRLFTILLAVVTLAVGATICFYSWNPFTHGNPVYFVVGLTLGGLAVTSLVETVTR